MTLFVLFLLLAASQIMIINAQFGDLPIPRGCEVIRCAEGYECDDSTFFPSCVAVDCSAQGACKMGYDCVPKEKECVRAPCPQFRCERGFSGCVTDCGDEIDSMTFYEGDGVNYCKSCFCFFNDVSFCLPMGECEEDEEASECEIPISCVLCVAPECDEDCENCIISPGSCEECPTATCQDNDCVFCTQEVPTCEESCENCEVTLQTCKECATATCKDGVIDECRTECGRIVQAGVTFQDDGSNFCNTCTCLKGGGKSCTRIACDDDSTEALCTTRNDEIFCETECGLLVESGINYNDDGENYCNSCFCDDQTGAGACTDMACDTSSEEAECN